MLPEFLGELGWENTRRQNDESENEREGRKNQYFGREKW
jgi:hypothetical protein